MSMTDEQVYVATRKFCAEHGHYYEKVPDAIQRQDKDDGTHILNAFVCRQCGDRIKRDVANWPKWKKGQPEEKF